MVQPDDLVQRLEKVLRQSPYRVSGLTVSEPEYLPDRQAVETLLSDCTKALDGWVARQSGVEVWRGGVRQGSEDFGVALAAELGSQDKTVQLRRLPEHWVLTRFEEQPGAASHLVEDIAHVTVHHGLLRYRRYWVSGDEGAAEPVAARLVGFGEDRTDD